MRLGLGGFWAFVSVACCANVLTMAYAGVSGPISAAAWLASVAGAIFAGVLAFDDWES